MSRNSQVLGIEQLESRCVPSFSFMNGNVYEDHNGNGIEDTNDTGIPGVGIILDGNFFNATDVTGKFSNQIGPGTFSLQISVPTYWTETEGHSGYILQIKEGTDINNLNFGLFRNVLLGGTVYNDHNADGVRTTGEEGLADRHILLDGVDSAVTDANGNYAVMAGPGTHTLQEVNQYGWVETQGKNGYTITTSSGESVPNNDFGNTTEIEGSAKNIKFWASKDGKKLETISDLVFLNNLNLRKSNGTYFDPVSQNSLGTWLTKANNVNESYMLSAQLAVMELNIRHNFVDPKTEVFVGTTSTLHDELSSLGLVDTNGFVSINDLVTTSNHFLERHAVVGGHSLVRKQEEALVLVLNDINNNNPVI